MHESPMTEGLALRWVEVADERGRTHLEMRWSAPAVPATVPTVAATSGLPAVTHAA